MSVTGDTANHDQFVHSAEVCALFPTRLDLLRRFSRTIGCLRNGWPRHSLSETLTLYSGQTIPNLQPTTCWPTSSRASRNLLNYARDHNSLWLHTEVSSINHLSSLWACVAVHRKITRNPGISKHTGNTGFSRCLNPPKCVFKFPP